MHSNNPVYGGEDDNQYPFAGTWNKVRGFLEENIQLFQEKLTEIFDGMGLLQLHTNCSCKTSVSW